MIAQQEGRECVVKGVYVDLPVYDLVDELQRDPGACWPPGTSYWPRVR
jgi:hypothetical protein